MRVGFRNITYHGHCRVLQSPVARSCLFYGAFYLEHAAPPNHAHTKQGVMNIIENNYGLPMLLKVKFWIVKQQFLWSGYAWALVLVK